MVEIGGKPGRWHIMKHYLCYWMTEFVIALGYKKEAITRYFRAPARSDYFELDGEDVTRFREKPVDGDGRINGAFFIPEPGVPEHMEGNTTSWKRGPMERLAADR
jgi:NDP-sugar pyrophosphorylase family protein